MTHKKLLPIVGALALAGCATTAPVVPVSLPSQMTNVAGLERVLGQTAAGLTQLFGEPGQDFREDDARKLQFAGASCVLDTYLYASSRGAEPVATYVDARNAQGDDVDRAACVEALARR